MQTKQYGTGKSMDQQGNQSGNLKIPKTNDNENGTIQNLRDTAKAVLRSSQ